MIISPPTLHSPQGNKTDEAWLDALLPDQTLGGYPVTSHFEWHGGLHLKLAGTGEANTIRAIANGNVMHYRDCGLGELSPPDDSPLKHLGLDTPGCVVLRHETEIGAGKDGCVVFYSVYQNLGKLDPAVITAYQTGKILPRKHPLGKAGYAGGIGGCHFEIFCTTENLRRLTGRTGGDLPLNKNGREHVLFGDLHFHLPSGTPYYQFSNDKPNQGPSHATLPPSGKTTEALYVALHFAGGNISLQTRRHQDEQYPLLPIAAAPVYWQGYEIGMAARADHIADLHPGVSASVVFELLRFGRLITKDNHHPLPASVPHWHKIATPSGMAWVNLNTPAITKYSDADFPHWLGWRFINDDPSDDGLCQSPTLHNWLLPGNTPKTKAALLAALPKQQSRLARAICRFPSEWDLNKLDARYGWTQKESPLNPAADVLTPASYAKLKTKISLLTFWEKIRDRTQASPAKQYYPEEEAQYDRTLEDAVWHFHPREFIKLFRKCRWLNSVEMEMVMLPPINRKLPRRHKELIKRYKDSLNLTVRKYLFDIGHRSSHFYGQGRVESGGLTSMVETAQIQIPAHEEGGKIVKAKGGDPIPRSLIAYEIRERTWWGSEQKDRSDVFDKVRKNSAGGDAGPPYSWLYGNMDGEDAQKFRGRGFKQLTFRGNYVNYWVYRGWLKKNSFDASWWDDPAYARKDKKAMKRRPAIIDNPAVLAYDAHAAIDSGGFYMAGERAGIQLKMAAVTASSITEVTQAINGGTRALPERKAHTFRADYILNDALTPVEIEKNAHPTKQYKTQFNLA